MGSTWVERHVTLDRTMWGSDQSSSIEPSGLIKLVKLFMILKKQQCMNQDQEDYLKVKI